jgi:hypothetical protein
MRVTERTDRIARFRRPATPKIYTVPYTRQFM